MTIELNNLYVIIGSEGTYDCYYTYESTIIGKENAVSRFNEWASEAPNDDDGEVALYKATIKDSVIVADYDNEIAHKIYNPETEIWEDYKEDE